METIRLKDCHEEGDGSIIERDIDQLKKGTQDWIGYSTSDEVQEEWIEQFSQDTVSAIVDCYEYHQGFVSIDTVELRAFCEKEIQDTLK